MLGSPKEVLSESSVSLLQGRIFLSPYFSLSVQIKIQLLKGVRLIYATSTRSRTIFFL